jgi:hypothetical protein
VPPASLRWSICWRRASKSVRDRKILAKASVRLVRSAVKRGSPGKVWAHDPANGKRRDLSKEEEHAFWAFAVVEVLGATGIRIEELTELSHHGLVQYRLPGTGELVPLLQIAPSKTDAERLLLVSPELGEVLAAIICRVRASDRAIPLVAAYDDLHHRCRPERAAAAHRRTPGYKRHDGLQGRLP